MANCKCGEDLAVPSWSQCIKCDKAQKIKQSNKVAKRKIARYKKSLLRSLEMLRLFVGENMTLKQIARTYKVSATRISNLIRHYPAYKKKRKNPSIDISIEDMVLNVSEGLKAIELYGEFDSVQYINTDAIEKLKIKINEALKKKSNAERLMTSGKIIRERNTQKAKCNKCGEKYIKILGCLICRNYEEQVKRTMR